MRTLRKVLASFVVVGFSLMLTVALALQVYRQTLTNPAFLQQAVNRPELVAAERTLILQVAARQLDPADVSESLGMETEKLLSLVVTDELLGTYNTIFLNALAQTLQGDAAGLRAIDLTPIQSRAIALMVQTAEERLKAIPDCKAGQRPTTGPDGAPTCIPADQRALVAGVVTAQAKKQAEALVPNLVPTHVDLTAQLEEGGVDLDRVSRPYRAGPSAWGVVAALLVLLVLLNLDQPFTPLGWIGGGALSAGLIVLGVGLLLKSAGAGLLIAALDMSDAGSAEMITLVNGLLQAVGSRVAITGGLGVAIGALCLIAIAPIRRAVRARGGVPA